MPEPSEPEEGPGAPGARAVHSAEIFCESCGRATSHRVVRLDPPPSRGPVGTLQGIARCRICHLTHRFRVEAPRTVELDLIVSEGPESVRRRLRLPHGVPLSVEGEVPELDEHLRILRLDTHAGRTTSTARTESVATIWATRETGARVPVSIVEGRRTRSLKIVFAPELRLAVGGPVRIEGRDFEVSAVRARGRTWRELGDGFSAREVVRLYVRRTVTPPAGNNDWTRDRGRPSSAARATSTLGRSRSSPGTSRTRNRPRERSADGGAAHHSSSPW